MTTTSVQPVAATTLSQRMREESRDAHTAAESSRFITDLLAGKLSRRAYGDYLLHLVGVYREMEEFAVRFGQHSAVRGVADPALFRGAALAEDLDYWVGRQWPAVAAEVELRSSAVQNYRTRVAACAQQPELFIAHHYTRYLGDLAGGQAIGRSTSRNYHLADHVGVAFYQFDQIAKPKPYRDAYRARLDSLDVSTDTADAIVAEVRHAFALNQALFGELADTAGFVRPGSH